MLEGAWPEAVRTTLLSSSAASRRLWRLHTAASGGACRGVEVAGGTASGGFSCAPCGELVWPTGSARWPGKKCELFVLIRATAVRSDWAITDLIPASFGSRPDVL